MTFGLPEYYYSCSCVDCEGQEIRDMVAGARPVAYRTMRKNCPSLLDWAKRQGYGRETGLTLQHDQLVGFFKSKFRGKPCYYVTWSAIEFIWTRS